MWFNLPKRRGLVNITRDVQQAIDESGIKEGIFREDTNFEVLLYILKENIEFITTTTMFDNYTIEQMSNTFILAYLRGVSTPKGQEIIEEYIKKQTK